MINVQKPVEESRERCGSRPVFSSGRKAELALTSNAWG
jgi:hypothetical protein